MAKGQTYSDEFKKQIVALYKNGKGVSLLSGEYNIGKSTIHKWINDYDNSGSFKK